MNNFQPYPIIAVAPVTKSGKEERTGIVEGEDISDETKKRIWTQAQERQIEDTSANRDLAYKIDGLVRFIVNIKRFSILNSYTLTSNDDVKNETLKIEIETFINTIGLLSSFRRVFTPLNIEGSGHLQKLYDGSTLSGLAVLRNLKRYTDPTNVANYYFYQNQLVSKKWRDPEEKETQALKVWYIDEAERGSFDTIKDGEDVVLARDKVIEFLNNESGESNLQTIVSYVFIKNFLIQLLPNLIEIITSPNEEIIYDTVDKTGTPCVPVMPSPSLKIADATKYTEEVRIYKSWKAGLAQLANQISNDRTKQRKTIHPDTITEKVFESGQSVNTDIIKALVHILDTQIAYGMGFSLSLIDAAGQELSTARSIFSTVAVTMRGIQQQFEAVAQQIINETFTAAIPAGIEFHLAELQPEDKLITAQQKKFYAEAVEILYNCSFDSKGINDFASRNIDEGLELFGGSEEGKEGAEKAIEAMLDYRNLQEGIEEE